MAKASGYPAANAVLHSNFETHHVELVKTQTNETAQSRKDMVGGLTFVSTIAAFA
jgi:hypothetical protein